MVQRWKTEQAELRARMIVAPLAPTSQFVAGADVAFSVDGSEVLAAALVYDRVEKRVIEIRTARRPIEVPYVPGFLSFREGPALLDAIGKIRHAFGVICFDGQGYAHPRRCGLATYLGVKLDVPSIGVAKSRLIGTHKEPAKKAGSFARLMDEGEQIGVVLRSCDGVRPLFVSIGHRVDLASARKILMDCCIGCRVPEPTRQADIEVGKLKRGE